MKVVNKSKASTKEIREIVMHVIKEFRSHYGEPLNYRLKDLTIHVGVRGNRARYTSLQSDRSGGTNIHMKLAPRATRRSLVVSVGRAIRYITYRKEWSSKLPPMPIDRPQDLLVPLAPVKPKPLVATPQWRKNWDKAIASLAGAESRLAKREVEAQKAAEAVTRAEEKVKEAKKKLRYYEREEKRREEVAANGNATSTDFAHRLRERRKASTHH